MNRVIKRNESVVNNTFVKMMEALGYEIELHYVKKEESNENCCKQYYGSVPKCDIERDAVELESGVIVNQYGMIVVFDLVSHLMGRGRLRIFQISLYQ